MSAAATEPGQGDDPWAVGGRQHSAARTASDEMPSLHLGDLGPIIPFGEPAHGSAQVGDAIPMRRKSTVRRRDNLLQQVNAELARRKKKLP